MATDLDRWVFSYLRQRAAVFPPLKSAKRSQALIGGFETTCIPWIPLVPEFYTDHIEKATFVNSASIFSETVKEIKLKFDEEIEKKLIYQDPSPFWWEFQYFCVNSSLKWRRSRLTAAKLQALSPFLVSTVVILTWLLIFRNYYLI